MTRFFDLKLYIEGLKKLKVAGVCFLSVIGFFAVLPPLTELFVRSVNDNCREDISILYLILPFILCVIFAPVAVMNGFSFLFKRSESDFYLSMPISRTKLFFSIFASCFTWILGALIICSALSLSLWAFLPAFSKLWEIFSVFIPVSLFTMLKLTALTAVCMFVSGDKRSFALSFIGSLASLYTLAFVLRRSAELLFPALAGYTGPASILSETVLSPFSLSFSSAPVITLWHVFYVIVLFVILTFTARHLFSIREAEYAEGPVTRKSFRAFIRLCVSFPVALCGVYNLLVYLGGADAKEHLSLDRLALIIPLALFALILWVICELILTKSIKQGLKSLAGVPLLIFAVSCYATGMLVMRGAIISFMPEEENVEAVCILNYTYGDFDNEADLINGYYSSEPEFIADVCEGVCNTAESIRNHTFEDKNTVTVTLKLKNGGTVTRRIANQYSRDVLITKLLENDRDFAERILTFDPDSFLIYRTDCVYLHHFRSIPKDDIELIYDAFCEEYAAASLEEKIETKTLRVYNNDDASITFHPDYTDAATPSAYFAVPPSFTKTRLAMMEAFRKNGELSPSPDKKLNELSSLEYSAEFSTSYISVISDKKYLCSMKLRPFSLDSNFREIFSKIANDSLSEGTADFEGSYVSIYLDSKFDNDVFGIIPVSEETAREVSAALSSLNLN